MLTVLAYLADASILITYFRMAGRPERAHQFDWANAVGCFPIIAVEVLAAAWPPLILTAAFGAIGWLGLWRAR